MKHLGMIKDKGSKVAVFFKTVPNEPENCLIVDLDALRPMMEDAVRDGIASPGGQAAFEFGDFATRLTLPDQTNMLESIHQQGLLKKMSTKDIIMTDDGSDVPLFELNKMIAEQKGMKVEELSVQESDEPVVDNDVAQKQEAAALLAQAEEMEAKASISRESAYALDPSLRPKRGRPVGTTKEATKTE